MTPMDLLRCALCALILSCAGIGGLAARAAPSLPAGAVTTPALTNNLGGRLGDQLMEYMQIKWLSLKYGLPIVLRPGPLFSQLALIDREVVVPVHMRHWAVRSEPLVDVAQLDNPKADTVYVVSMFPENEQEYRETGAKHPRYDIDWEDPSFRSLIKELVRPKQPIPRMDIPLGRISVALHLRRGGGFRCDTPAEKDFVPLKFPPLEWYCEQLVSLRKTLGPAPLYVHIFTDDDDPAALCRLIKQQWQDCGDVLFGYRTKGNQHNANVLEDLFAMTQCDCLIRSMSSYSLTASKIGDFFVEIFPVAYQRRRQRPVITGSQTLIRRPLEELLRVATGGR